MHRLFCSRMAPCSSRLVHSEGLLGVRSAVMKTCPLNPPAERKTSSLKQLKVKPQSVIINGRSRSHFKQAVFGVITYSLGPWPARRYSLFLWLPPLNAAFVPRLVIKDSAGPPSSVSEMKTITSTNWDNRELWSKYLSLTFCFEKCCNDCCNDSKAKFEAHKEVRIPDTFFSAACENEQLPPTATVTLHTMTGFIHEWTPDTWFNTIPTVQGLLSDSSCLL